MTRQFISKLRLGTRASKLALWQAHHVRDLLAGHGVAVEIKTIVTQGDTILDKPLFNVGGKGLFLKEIEDALLKNEIDFAVHSLKDVPHTLPDGLQLAAILKREDPSDAFVSRDGTRIENLPPGQTIGTSSLRRLVQLKLKFPHLVFQSLRGNVDTRLKKLDQGEYAGIVLASAGLIRLGLQNRIVQKLPIVSAVGQGAIALECRQADAATSSVLKRLNDAGTQVCVELERQFLRTVQGACDTPVGCRVEPNEKGFTMEAFLAKADGSEPKFWQWQGTSSEVLQFASAIF